MKLYKKLTKEDLDKYDIAEGLEELGNKHKFDVALLLREYGGDNQYGIAAFVQTTYDFDGTEKFSMPKETTLIKKWEKIAKVTGIRKKPAWYLFTEYS
jgi:hypothetical protein